MFRFFLPGTCRVNAALIFLLLRLGEEMIRNDAMCQGAKPELHCFCVTTP